MSRELYKEFREDMLSYRGDGDNYLKRFKVIGEAR